MYKGFTSEDYKKYFNLSAEYSVSGLLSSGTWNEEEYFKEIHEVLKGLNIGYSSKRLEGFLSHIYEIKIDGKIYWLSSLYGGVMLSEYIHLACLFGSKKNIHIGSCGGLYPNMKTLDFLIPSYSYGDESTTRMYDRKITDNKHFPNESLSNFLVGRLPAKSKIWRGPVTTCQAMLGETFEDVAAWSKDGYYGVDMETSTLFSISNYFKVPSSALLYVADNLIENFTVLDEEFVNNKKVRDEIKNNVYRTGLLTLIEYSLS
ncbi:MAG: hypothetical protein WC719_00350 [Patescibacteria group bacterium]|jgi:purine-nucleoside phosphorylase